MNHTPTIYNNGHFSLARDWIECVVVVHIFNPFLIYPQYFRLAWRWPVALRDQHEQLVNNTLDEDEHGKDVRGDGREKKIQKNEKRCDNVASILSHTQDEFRFEPHSHTHTNAHIVALTYMATKMGS